jgi:hypothetical protein
MGESLFGRAGAAFKGLVRSPLLELLNAGAELERAIVVETLAGLNIRFVGEQAAS